MHCIQKYVKLSRNLANMFTRRVRYLRLQPGQSISCFSLLSKYPKVGYNCQEVGYYINNKSKLCLTYYSSDKTDQENIERILNKARQNEKRKRYPAFGESRRKQSHNKPSIKELISKLKGQTDEMALSPETSEKRTFDHRIPKTEPYFRVQVLQKHDTQHSPAKATGAKMRANQKFAKDKNSSKTTREKVEDNVLHEKQREKIVPDETEVGGLLAALIDGRMTESNVKEVMANALPPRKAQLSDEKASKVRENKATNNAGKQLQKLLSKGKLFNGPRTHYLDDLFAIDDNAKERNYISIHETKWRKAVRDSVPSVGPSDGFEALLLDAEKLWTFPIDNEQGLDEEELSEFEDHVFLDHYLEMFPEQGQVRRFMELVITGLQQNPYCTVQEKIEKINWFKDYFDKFSPSDLEF